jgi:hypothetical protein
LAATLPVSRKRRTQLNNRTDPEIEQGSSLLPGQTTLNLRHCTLS